MLWKRAKPVYGEVPVNPEEWWYEFSHEFNNLCQGLVDREWLDTMFTAIHPLAREVHPRATANLVFAALTFRERKVEQPEHAGRTRRFRLNAAGLLRRTHYIGVSRAR